jgi:putative spermidine/putrescine transport system substrate-binding protein
MTVTRMMRLSGAVAAVAAVLAAGPTYGKDKLTIVSWGGAFQKAQEEAFFVPYAKETGADIAQDSWNGELAKIKAMVDTKNVTWDVIDADYEHAITGCAEGFLEPIDATMFGDPKDFLPGALHKCGVSVDISSLIFGYDAGKLKDGPKTIADVFDTKKWPGRRGLRKQPKQLFEHVLMADGVPPEKVYEVLGSKGGVDRVLKKLDTIKKDIVWWTTNAQAPQLLADGEVVIAEIFNGRLYDAAKKEKKNFVPIWDGQVYLYDTFIVPKGANKDAAFRFLKYVMEPKVLARFSSFFPYPPTRRSALQHVSKEILPHLPTAPANFKKALSTNEEWWADNIQEVTARFQNWLAK